MESYVCPQCQGVVSSSRRRAHEATWCPSRSTTDSDSQGSQRASDAGSDAESETEELRESKAPGGPRAVLSSLNQEEVVVRFGSLPGLELTLAQRDMWGPSDTGGVLWYADRVMAEYVAHGALDGPPGLALVLGCGGAPLSGLAASALGWDVVLTDLGIVLEQARENVDKNSEVLKDFRRQQDGQQDEAPSITVAELPWGNAAALDSALAHLEAEARPLVVLCSDCIWRRAFHQPLLATLSSALRRRKWPGGAASALVCFQARDRITEAMFLSAARSDLFDLDAESVDLSAVFPHVQWPPQLMATDPATLAREFHIFRLTPRPPALSGTES